MRWMVWRRRVYHAVVRRDLRVLALAVSAAALLLMIEGLELRLRPVALALTETQLQNRVTAVVEETLSSQPEAAALLTVQRGSDGRVLSGTADMAAANRLRSQVAAALLAEFQSQTHTVAIPAGSLLGADALWARGPALHIRVLSAGTISTRLRSELHSAGINQTLYRLWLEVSVPLTVLLPGQRAETAAETQLCLTEAVIVGQVPDAYLAPWFSDTAP